MSTYAQVQARIADDLNRADLTTQIQQQILLAIRYYRNRRFWFNETSSALTATIGQVYVSPPADLLTIDDLYITISGRSSRLVPKDLNDIIEYRSTSNGQPMAYCYYQDRFELDRPPAQAYSLPLYYIKELTALSAAGDTNGWTTDGEDLIVFRAEKMLYGNVLKNREKATTAEAFENQALAQLISMRTDKTTTGTTTAYYL